MNSLELFIAFAPALAVLGMKIATESSWSMRSVLCLIGFGPALAVVVIAFLIDPSWLNLDEVVFQICMDVSGVVGVSFALLAESSKSETTSMAS